MSDDLLTLYRAWVGNASAIPPDLIPLGNLDVFEDDSKVINRLFWAIPSFAGGSLRLFLFFEQNLFLKDDAGDLTLFASSLHTLHL